MNSLENVYGYSGRAAEKYVLDLREYTSSKKVYYYDDGERNADSWKFISINGYEGNLANLNPSEYDTPDPAPKPPADNNPTTPTTPTNPVTPSKPTSPTQPVQNQTYSLLQKVKATKSLSIKKDKTKTIKVTIPKGLKKVT